MGVQWDDDALARQLRTIPEQAHRALSAVITYHSTSAVRTARTTAPWTDRTTNARNGLTSKTYIEKHSKYAFVLAHTVEYGIWLEVRFSGRYAVIGPTIDSEAPATMEDAGKLFARMFGG